MSLTACMNRSPAPPAHRAASTGSCAGSWTSCRSRKVSGFAEPYSGGSDIIVYSPPTRRGGGIWNPNGPTVYATGHPLVVSANGAAVPGDAVGRSRLEGEHSADQGLPGDGADDAVDGDRWGVLV